jgi:hypothetical protein
LFYVACFAIFLVLLDRFVAFCLLFFSAINAFMFLRKTGGGVKRRVEFQGEIKEGGSLGWVGRHREKKGGKEKKEKNNYTQYTVYTL